MRIGILTNHTVHNHGAVLQLYALEKVLEQKGCSACALNYKRNYDFLETNLTDKYELSFRSIPYYFSFLKERGLGSVVYNYKKRKLLSRFKREKEMVGEYYSRAKSLDAVFVGSDEVFSIDVGMPPCMYGHGVPSEHIFSYGASFGSTGKKQIENRHVQALIESGIRQFEMVSVRDQNSLKLVRSFGRDDAALVCDPVILYGYQAEKAKMRRPVEEKYVLCYSYDKNMNRPEEQQAIRAIAARMGAKVYSVGFYHKWCDRSVNVDPIELLGYVLYAELVVTDTFHGSVMSIITNTPFCAMARGNSNKLENLLDEYGLSGRLVQQIEEIQSLSEKEINWIKVNKSIEERKTIGITFIESCLEKCKTWDS